MDTSRHRREFGLGRGLAVRSAMAGMAGLLLAGLVSAPTVTVAQAAGPGGPGYGSQLVPGGRPSVVVLGTGKASAPAESGRLQFVVRAVDPYAQAPVGDVMQSPNGQPPLLSEDQAAPLAEALVAIGVPDDAVEIVVAPAFGGFFGPGSAQVLVELEGEDLERVDDLVEATTTAAGIYGLYVESVGVGYRADGCEELLREARLAAAADGLARAEDLAEAVGVEIGGLLLATEAPSYNDGSGFGCSPATPFPGSLQGVYLPSFVPNAEAEVEAYVQLNLAYEILGTVGDGTPEAS